ncbi:HNH endonuclease [Paenibacillus sp. Y412MC10]|uniref:HNH endonuclease n=1 Tax=Geobacillus sp. (strain Y412MC10) TaxID=481743 RepID=UPI00017894CB|nr:HNH endonuclease signature motif containing protein [Paenibacillus sp. Y412MC10]ACX63345.1 HNH nuclease [Paenibacillus sp. Y412MC10]
MIIEANLRIWKAYQKKCFYCDEDVSWRELHIDHFIPRHLDSDLKKEILSDLKLDVDFEFNSLKNLVPSHSSCNTGRKGKLVPKPINIAGTLLITENQIPKILEIKEKLDLEEKYDENIAFF